VLGRGVVLRQGDGVPAAWAGAEVVQITESVLGVPGRVVAALHHAWVTRRPVAVVLAVDPARFRDPMSFDAEPWRLDACFEVWLDRLHFLVWANNYDARGGRQAKWWWSHKAGQVGAREIPDGRCGDVLLPDGTAAWIDGGPRGPFARAALGAVVVHAESVELGRLVPAPEPVVVRSVLAPDQLAAVSHGSGPARIIAPAGSGKTRVLTERLRHLMLDRGFEREHVVAVAYNKKAQLEMQQRTADFLPRVSTLNSLGYQLLKRHAGRAPSVLKEREVRRVIDGLLPSVPHRPNVDPLAPYLEALSAVRLGLRSPDDVEAERADVPGLADIFVPYRRALADQGAVDFDEQIYRAIEVLLRDGSFRRRVQARCRHLLVDEFQDLTAAHVLLLRLIASPGLQVFGVGDDDQVIYGHAGADPAFLIDFERLFPGAASHPLKVNYRCPIAVVEAARSLLSHNHFRVPKEIQPGPAALPDATAMAVQQHGSESGAAAVVGIVQDWLKAGVPASEIAVLTRVNSLLLAPYVALVEAGVPVITAVSPDMLERTGVRAALAYIRLGASPDRLQPDDLCDVRNRPSRGFPKWITKWLQSEMSIDELRSTADRITDFRVSDKLARFADDLQLVADTVRMGTTRQVLSVIADTVGLGRALTLLDHSKGGQSESQVDDLDALIQVSDLHPDPVTFESWLRGLLARRGDHRGVMLSTVHRVKGMEWDRVIVAGVAEGVFPHRLAEDREEERRVMHVAITRCRQQVVVLSDASRPSSFVRELSEATARPAARGGNVVPRASTASLPLSPQDDPAPEVGRVMEALRAWRRERSQADQVPAYIVAADTLLGAIAQVRPATLDELARIKGIGPKKLQLYGREILAVVQSAAADPPA
jgi:DNA helicase-2/ATP-dependent DNA helicase PcrA